MSGTLRLRGSTSGYSELQAPAVAADQTFVLPTAGGTLITTDSPVPKLTLGLGSASEPSLTFQGDTDTGLFSEGTNTLNLVTGGSSKVVLGAAAHTIYAGTGATVRAIDIDSSGRVGVGTSSPSYLLDCKSTGTTNVARFLTGSTSSSEVAQFGRSDQAVNLSIDYDGAGSMGIGTTTAHPFNLKTGAVTHATIDTSGRLGIGTTSPGTLLHIASSSVDPEIRLVRNPGSGNINSVKSNFYDLSVTSGRNFIVNTGGSERARIDSSGRLLVGTSSAFGSTASELLQVANANGGKISLLRNDASIAAGNEVGVITWYSADGNTQPTASIACQADGDHAADDKPGRLVFSTTADGAGSATEKMRIDSSGNVGINTTGPAAKLDVNGNQTSNVVAMAALDVDCSAGNYFTKTINANSTFTFSNVPASRSYSFVLELTHTSGTVTWPASVKFPADTAPTLTTGKTHLFVFETNDGGTRFRGASLVDYVN